MTAPFEIVTIQGANAHKTWVDLRERKGVVPIFFGKRTNLDAAVDVRNQSRHTFEEILDIGLGLNVEAWMQSEIDGDSERFNFDEREAGKIQKTPAFTPAFDLRTMQPLEEVVFGLIPVEAPWMVPAYLKFGGWNDCPDASVHLAFFRRWFDRYGAVVTTFAGDVIEFHINRPPTTKEASQDLAREQYVYCSDIVDQGVDTLGNLRECLINSSNWYFWWD